MNISFFNKRILLKFYGIIGAISILTSIIILFVDIDAKWKSTLGVFALIVLIAIYIGLWIHACIRQSICLKINASEVEVKFGDIFEENADLKAIGFNEYFDTQVNNVIISAKSLHGQYIEKFYKDRVADLDNLIAADQHLSEAYLCDNTTRLQGKKAKYKLGTVVTDNEYLLIAFSRFDDNNKAYLEINDYISCLLNFWNEVDRVYAGRTVALPLLGSGITRFKGYDSISDQELLELIIWTFKVSRIKFAYPSRVKIVVYKEKSERINLLALKDLE